MNSAGTAAQRCGWSVNRVESTANIAQPSANPHSTAPVTALSCAGTNGAATRSSAATSPVANEPATALNSETDIGGTPFLWASPTTFPEGSVATLCIR